MNGLKALIFDVDGTLAETEEGHRDAFNRAFAERGLPYRWDQTAYRALLETTGGRQRLERFFAEDGMAPDEAASLAAELHLLKNRHYASIVAEGGIGLRPGIAETLDRAQALGIRLAIATTTGRANLDALFAGIGNGLAARFELTVTGNDVARLKPDPEAYLLALRRLGLSPDEALAVEDSLNGLCAAEAAGLKTLVTPSLYTAHQDFAGAFRVLDRLDLWPLAAG